MKTLILSIIAAYFFMSSVINAMFFLSHKGKQEITDKDSLKKCLFALFYFVLVSPIEFTYCFIKYDILGYKNER